MTVNFAKSIDVICPNCDRIVTVPIVVGCMLVRGKSLYLQELSAKAPHTCRQAALETSVPVDDAEAGEKTGWDAIAEMHGVSAPLLRATGLIEQPIRDGGGNDG